MLSLWCSALYALLPPRFSAARLLDYAWITPVVMLLFSLYIVYAGWWVS
jgi:hypothetical protein